MKISGRKGNVKGSRMVKEETRVPLCMAFILDFSGSMSLDTRIINENGSESCKPKIKQMQEGFRKSVKSLRRFKKENVKFDVKYQVISLDSYGEALFDGYKPVDDPQYDSTEMEFEANGVTNVEASFNTLVKFLTQKALGHYNRSVNVIMLSDGVPTDVNGYPLSEAAWKKVVDMLNDYLEKNDLARSVTFHFIAVGDEAEAFGRYFAGDDHFYKVDDCENIGDKLDFVTRQSLAESTTVTGDAIGYGESCDEDDEEHSVCDEDEDDSDEDEYDEDDYDISDDEDEPDVDEDEDVDEDDSSDSDEEDEDDDDGDDGDDDGSLDKILDF